MPSFFIFSTSVVRPMQSRFAAWATTPSASSRADETMATDIKTEKPRDQIGEINKLLISGYMIGPPAARL